MGDTTALERDQAYREGAEATSEVPIIYIDPDRLDSDNPVAAGAELRAQLEAQVPGSAAALQERFEEAYNESLGATDVSVPMAEMAPLFDTAGPMAINRVIVGDQEYCVINEPAAFIDETYEIAPGFSHSMDPRLLDNIQGSDLDYNRYIGRHEGEHCNAPEDESVEPDSYADTAQVLAEEVRADNSALDDDRMRLEIKDLRSLAAGSDLYDHEGDRFQDPEHATGSLLGDDGHDTATIYHAEAAEDFRDDMNGYVQMAIDDGSYTGEATTPAEVLEQDPDAFFAISEAGFAADRVVAEAQNTQNPSFEGAERLAVGQIKSDYAHNFEDAYRRRILGQDVPETDPPQYYNEESVQAFYDYAEAQQEPYVREEVCTAEATVVAPSGLNMREEPSQFSALVGPDDDGKPAAANFGDNLSVYGSEESSLGGVWREAVNSDGRTGWVSENYLDVGPETCAPANINSSPVIINAAP